jgi:tRNA pseudouridine13 synthase
VGYSGLKDRHAVAEQWFSIHLPGRPDPVLEPAPAGIRVLERVRHSRKLNRGTHGANHFRLVLSELRGDERQLRERLGRIRDDGVPNYFGPQRFGHGGGNWDRGRAWLAGAGEAPRKRHLRGLWLSAVRSRLFNEVLAERVRRECWNRPLAGDILQPQDSRGLFAETDEPRAAARMRAGEIHPTAPLPGVGGMASSRACRELEDAVLGPYSAEVAGLVREGTQASRRSTRLMVSDLEWQLSDDRLVLAFSLPAGAFATAVLEELARVNDAGGTPG